MTNEAAERLRNALIESEWSGLPFAADLLDEALAAERRPLADALRDAAILFHRHTHDADWVHCNSPECKRFRAILDEEAAR
jgi:hypothetical protein